MPKELETQLLEGSIYSVRQRGIAGTPIRLTINWAEVHMNDMLHSDLTRYAGSLSATEICYAKRPSKKLSF